MSAGSRESSCPEDPTACSTPTGRGSTPACLALGIPVLGLCYGHQLMAQSLGGKVVAGKYREYGTAQIDFVKQSPLLAGLSKREQIWMSHGDAVETLPPGFRRAGIHVRMQGGGHGQ